MYERTEKGTRIYRKGTVIIKEGEKDKTIYFLLKGKIGIFKNGKQISVVDKPNTPFGEISAILELPRTADCIALEDSEVLAYQGGIDEIVQRFPKAAKNIIISLAERLAKTTTQLQEKEEKRREEKKEVKEEKEEKGVVNLGRFSFLKVILEIEVQQLSRLLSKFSDDEIAKLIATSPKEIRERIENALPRRKIESIRDLIHKYETSKPSFIEIEAIIKKYIDQNL